MIHYLCTFINSLSTPLINIEYARWFDRWKGLVSYGSSISLTSTMDLKASSDNIQWNSDTTYALGLCRRLAQNLGYWPINSGTIFRVAIISFIQVSFIILKFLLDIFVCLT